MYNPCIIKIVRSSRHRQQHIEEAVVAPSPMLVDPDMLAVRALYLSSLSTQAPALQERAAALLDTLSDASWALEWYLPRWAGDAFHLPEHQIHALVLANVYGLSYIRLWDDLQDQPAGRDSALATACLANLLYRLALHQYVRLFDEQSPFWRSLDGFMADWLAAGASNDGLGRDFAHLTDDDLLALAARAAPLKICCAGACILAQREDRQQMLFSAVDHALAALVLVDHLDDWQQDLEAGRFNLFIAYCSSLPQAPETREQNRTQALAAWYGNGTRPYVSLAIRQIEIATRLASAIPCIGLRDYLRTLAQQTSAHSRYVATEAKARLHAAVQSVLSPAAEQPYSGTSRRRETR